MRENPSAPPDPEAIEKRMTAARLAMVDDIRGRAEIDERILSALSAVRRHVFFTQDMLDPALAYGGFQYPIGWGAAISQPFIVAYMTRQGDGAGQAGCAWQFC